MRLHTLTISGFGPFAGRESVDFDQLSSEGLFLFCGQTGAGKTSILDAVAFALYGTLPGARATMRNRLRSDHALMTTPTFVELVCTLGADTVRIHRSPEYQRPKKSGSGTTLQKHKVSLERRESDGSWVAVSDRADAVGDFVLDRLGLNADQFFQVVLLPQGAFAQFLLAEDNAREEVLRSLFNARRFSDVEAWFAQRRTEQRADVAIVQARLGEFVTRASQVAGLADDERPVYRPQGWFDTLVEEAAQRAAEAAAEVERADRVARGAEKAASAARELAGKQERLAAAYQAQIEVGALRPAIEQIRSQVEAADRARQVQPLLVALDRAVQQEASTSAAVSSARTQMSRSAPIAAEYDRPTLNTWVQECDQLRGGLSVALTDEQEVKALTTEEAPLRSRVERAEAALQTLTIERDQLPARIADQREALAVAEAEAAGRADAAKRLALAQRALQAAQQAELLQGQVSLAQDALRAAVDLAQETKAGWLRIRERRIEGMAAELAAVLVDGAQCPVCGASEHPHPARSGADAPSPEDERAAQERADRADLARGDQAAKTSALQVTLSAAQASADGRSVAVIAAEISTEQSRLQAIDLATARVSALKAELDRSTQRQLALDEETKAAVADRDTARQTHERLLVQIQTRTEKLEAARADFESVALRVRELDRQITLGRQLLDVLDQHSAATSALQQADAGAIAEASGAGFADLAEARAASLGADRRAALSAQVREFDQAANACEAILASPDLRDLPADPAPTTATLESYEQARDASLLAHAVHKQALTDKDHLIRISNGARGVLEQAAPALAALEEIEQLAGLMRGEAGNNHRMRLTSYVLAARLEQVAEAASERLEIMSKGRYRLEHTDTRLNRRGTGGLGLLVVDSHTGRSRPTRTLSGGESFLASLALALGLAEVVTAEAGATTLESLFVDEGFGSLDADTLDVVMSTLDDLRAGGRAIGLISHVEDLKSRIQAKLYLSRTSSGSHIHEQSGDQLELMSPLVRGIA